MEKAQALAVCKAACVAKCPVEPPPCPLKQFEDEDLEDFARRCKAAAELAQQALASDSLQGSSSAPVEDDVNEFDEENFDEESEPIDDISSPEDEW